MAVPNQLTVEDQTGLQEFIPRLAHWFPLDRSRALAYFENSSFFAAASRDAVGQPVIVNNNEARLAGLDPAAPGVLESMPHNRPEFVLETSQEPHAFVIRKQIRTSANPLERPTVQAYYYIANNKIMQAPSVHQVTHARLQRCTYDLRQGFRRLQQDMEPLTRQHKLLQQQKQRRERQQQQQQQGMKRKLEEGVEGEGPSGRQGEGAGMQAGAQRVKAEDGGEGAGAGPGPGSAAAAAAALTREGGLGPGGRGEPGDAGAARGAPAGGAGPGGGGLAGGLPAEAARAVYGTTVALPADPDAPSLGTLRAPLAAPLPEVMAAAAAATSGVSGGPGGVPVRRHLSTADRERWNKLDRILGNQFASLQRLRYSALPPEYLQRLHEQMHGPPPAPQPQQQQQQSGGGAAPGGAAGAGAGAAAQPPAAVAAVR